MIDFSLLKQGVCPFCSKLLINKRICKNHQYVNIELSNYDILFINTIDTIWLSTYYIQENKIHLYIPYLEGPCLEFDLNLSSPIISLENYVNKIDLYMKFL